MDELKTRKKYYTCKDWDKDTLHLIDIIREKQSKNEIHLIAPMFGGIMIANKIRNIINCKISLVKMSRYTEKDKKATWVYNDSISVEEELIIIDDLYDSGVTLKETLDLVKESYPNNKVRVLTIFGSKDAPSWLEYLYEKDDKWIVFPWE